MKNNSLYEDLIHLSAFLGSNIDLVQGGGGNTSVKIEGKLFVKASGFWLSDAGKKNIFTSVEIKNVIKEIKEKCTGSTSTEILLEKNNLLRPSIETTMHILMPHRFVVHFHSVNVLAYAILKDGYKKIQKKLSGIKFSWIPYVKPGILLTRKMYNIVNLKADVIILGNHGIIIGGDTKHEVMHLLSEIENRLKIKPRVVNISNLNKMSALLDDSNYKLPKYKFSHSLAFDDVALNHIKNLPLYPDHVIFIGSSSIPILSIKEFLNYSACYDTNKKNNVIVIKDVGVVVREDFSQSGEDMLHCLNNVLLRVGLNDKLNYLTKEEINELIDWEPEKYRRSLNN